jgi:alpha-L-arabinofuranosidase
MLMPHCNSRFKGIGLKFIAATLIFSFAFPGAASAPVVTPSQQAMITVDADKVINHVSARMYAAFVEMMNEDVKRGMTAEMLLDRSFEDAPDYLHLPAHWQIEPDERNDNGGAIHFDQSAEEAISPNADPSIPSWGNIPQHSLRVTVTPGDVAEDRIGFSQGHISITANQHYTGYIWLKQAKGANPGPYSGKITALLEEDNTDGATYTQSDSTVEPSVQGNDWKQYRFDLTPSKTDRFAKLTFLFNGHGSLFLDQASLEPANAKGEVRPDTEAMIAKLHPSFIRWPGGNVAQDYHWQWGIGPRDLRPVWINKAWSNAPEPDDLGTDEYLALCNRLHIEPSITVNVEGNGATSEEAAAWVEYVNGPVTSKYGAMRAANGHPEPYSVKQWELGNEVFGDWVRGHSTAEVYAKAAVRYAAAMKAADPTIKLVAVGEGIMPEQESWNSTVLKISGPVIDYLAIHDYTSASQNAKASDPYAQVMWQAGEFERGYHHTGELIAQLAPGRNIRQIVNEWNLFYDADTIENMTGAVFASRMMNGFERNGDTIEANSISDMLNGWAGGILQSSRDRIYGTAQFHAVKMYADHLGSDRLFLAGNSPDLRSGVSAIDALATRSSDGSHLFVKLSNADREHPVKTSIAIKSFPYASHVELDLLKASKPGIRSTFSNPEAVIPSHSSIECRVTCTVEMPASSVAVLTFTRSPK